MKRSDKQIFRLFMLVYCLLIWMVISGMSANCVINYTWNGSGNWSDPTKWTPNGIPGASDNATINSGTVTLTANTSVLNLTINGGTTLNGNYHLDINGNLEHYGSLFNYGDVTIDGTFYCNGGIIGDGTEAGLVTIAGLSTILYAYVKKKTLVLDGGANAKFLSIGNGGCVRNPVGQTYMTNCDGPGDCGIVNALGGGGTFENFGTLIHSNSVAVYFTIDKFIPFYNAGLVQVSQGEAMELQTTGTFTNDNTLIVNGAFYNPGVINNNGILKGTGTIDQISTVNNNSGSSIAPGTSPGKFTVTGSFNLGSGTYNCEINGTGQGTTYDWLAISGAATLTNAHLIVDWGSYTPSPGTFTILTCGSRIGEFATTTIPPVAGLTFDVSYTANAVMLSAQLLPVELAGFTGEETTGGVQLSWKTASEQSNQGFEVQRRAGAEHWQMLGFVPGNGTATSPHSYSFLDERPMSGTNYYRLKQIDMDGTFEYSHTISVEITGKNLLVAISPNPNHGRFTLNIQNPPSFPMAARLLDACGRAVWEANLEEGTQGASVDGQWPSGLYTLQLFGRHEVWAGKVVIR